MPRRLQLQSAEKPAKTNFDIEKAKGGPMLQWVGKRPLDKVEYYPAQEKEFYGDKNAKDFNELFWGDNLQVLAHLLKKYRGKVDLIYIDPPFDSKAQYARKVQFRGEKIKGTAQGLLEDKQYSDIWGKDEYLQFMYERLLLMKELLSDKGTIYLHCDWHKSGYLRLIMDEVFGQDNFINEIIWHYTSSKSPSDSYGRKHDNIFHYSKNPDYYFKHILKKTSEFSKSKYNLTDEKGLYKMVRGYKKYYKEEIPIDDVWDIPLENVQSKEIQNYPTQKPIKLLEQIIATASQEGDIVADFFMGSGTTCVTAQRMGRRWIGCDINLGAIQITIKRIGQIIKEEQKGVKDFMGSLGFKVPNVNDYDVFKNELEAKEVVMEMYGVETIRQSYFDGVMDNDFVKVMPINRVLNKMDIRNLLQHIRERMSDFTVREYSKKSQSMYEEGVRIICSGMEPDILDFLKKENNSGVNIQINDILVDTKNLIFKEYPESKIDVKSKDKELMVEIKEFYSPLLMKKLELENQKMQYKAKVEDFRQIIDSVAIDVDYDGKLFNAEIIDLPTQKELIKAKYDWKYQKKGKYAIAVKIVDVLGEEYFETFEVSA